MSTPLVGCAQMDHTPYGLVRPPGALPGALSGRSQPRGAMTFPLRPSDYPFVPFASDCIPEKTAPGCIPHCHGEESLMQTLKKSGRTWENS